MLGTGSLPPSLPVTLIEELHCAGQVKAVRKLQGKRLSQLQPLPQTLHAWALLQLDGAPRVCKAASSRLASAAKNRSFREKVGRAGQGAAPATGAVRGGGTLHDRRSERLWLQPLRQTWGQGGFKWVIQALCLGLPGHLRSTHDHDCTPTALGCALLFLRRHIRFIAEVSLAWRLFQLCDGHLPGASC